MKKIFAVLCLFSNPLSAWVELSDGSYMVKVRDGLYERYVGNDEKQFFWNKERTHFWVTHDETEDVRYDSFDEAWNVFLSGAEMIDPDAANIAEYNLPSPAPWLK